MIKIFNKLKKRDTISIHYAYEEIIHIPRTNTFFYP